MEYIEIDPNKLKLANSAQQRIKLVFGMWEYRFEVIAEICTNHYGLDLIDYLIDDLYEKLDKEKESRYVEIIMKNKKGDTLSCLDDFGDERFNPADWLKEMLVGYEIIDFKQLDTEEPLNFIISRT